MKLDENGYAINDEGQRVKGADGNEMHFDGVTSQEVMNKQVQSLKGEIKKQKATIGALDKAGADVSELKAQLAETEKEKDQAQAGADEAAQKKVAAQLAKANKDRDEALQGFSSLQKMVERNDVERIISAAAAEAKFRSPHDAISRLYGLHKREPVMVDGKPTDEIQTTFRMGVKDDQGKITEQFLPADKALELVATQFPHYVEGNGAGGPPGGPPSRTHIRKRSELRTVKEKAAFIGEHGYDAFAALADD